MSKGRLSKWQAESRTAKRIKAFLVDLAVIFVLSALVGEALMRALPALSVLLWLATPLVFTLVLVAYFTLTEGSALGGSLGLRVFGLRVQRKDGSPIGYEAALLRTLFFFATVIFLTPLVLLLVPLTGGRRALHDFVAGGVVTDAR